MAELITIPAPCVPFPGGRTQADFMRSAADHIAGDFKVGGRNVRETVIALLRDVAVALDQSTGGQPSTGGIDAMPVGAVVTGRDAETGAVLAAVAHNAATGQRLWTLSGFHGLFTTDELLANIDPETLTVAANYRER